MRSERRASDPRGRRIGMLCLVSGLGISHAAAVPAPTALPEPSVGWALPDSTYAWSFPRDHRAHPRYRTEWWYLTGQLHQADGTRLFGYQFTLFRVGLLPEPPGWNSSWDTRGLVLGHFAVTDPGAGRHRFAESLVREMPLLGGFPEAPDPRLAWCRAPAGSPGAWELREGDGGFRVSAVDRARGMSLDLVLREDAPILFHGPGGWSRKDAPGDAASLYYSIPRLSTRGTLRLDEEVIEVEGSSWLDREWSTRGLGTGQVGWDWLGLQLEDGRSLMLYRLREAGGASHFASGTLASGGGRAESLDGRDWSREVLRTWTSPRTGAVYPVAWRVAVPGAGLDFRIEPLLDDQENVSTRSGGVSYWEGAIRALGPGGELLGRGYLELTGYAGDALVVLREGPS